MSRSSFRDLLETGDVENLRKYWAEIFPGMPQPQNRKQAEIVMHRARTEAESVSLRARAYSHRWLTERDFPSGLPDRLKPSAERMYPIVVEAVGISVNMRSPYMKPAAVEIQAEMSNVVEECYADNVRDPEIIKARMQEAKTKTMHALFGR